ncbi:MAG TPA: hypothetical protein PLE92_11450 [Lentisphaeria bacterium]|nr:hypothetical protein [Lentisphaerota bacterium]OQC12522.1 MAG: hypothetical protein BWX73_02813 [Lentisphaerae bacterium ADurb.Bin082]HQC53743.1 hypothetical protein [Lentisphaeria bacterium]HQL86625.1 hypothetical protein [Lentisphaeria bacterium]
MAYFYTERGRRLFVRVMFGLVCWFMMGVALATVREGNRHAVDVRRLAVDLAGRSRGGELSAQLSSDHVVTLLRACAVDAP